jgi:hydroxymethylglutaryl-CoA lyase
MGVANVVAAYQAGVTRFEGSAGGLGGCPFAPRSTGNVASEDSLQALQRIGAGVSVDLDAYCEVAQRLGEDLGMQLPGKLHRAGVWHPERIGREIKTA